MPITSFTVDGVERSPLIETLEIRETIGGVSTLSCDIVSVGSPVTRFAVFSEVAIVEDGVTIFSGTITQAREQGAGGPVLDDAGNPQITTKITVEDHNRIADRVSATETVVAGTLLKTFLTTLVTNYLTSFSVTLDGAQVNGPALPDMSFDISRLSEVLQALADATGYLWRIDYDKQLRMWAPGDLTAPFDIDESDVPAKWGGDVEVETILGDNYANRVIVIGAPVEEESHVETFTGDGSTSVFTLEWTVLANYGYVNGDTSVPLYQTLTVPPFTDADWIYDPVTNTLTRQAGPLPLGQVMSFTFKGTFSPRATAEDAGEIAAHGLYEHIERRDDVSTTQAAAQAIADELLAQLLTSGEQTITYTTRVAAAGFRAGQLQNIVAPSRDVSGDFIIRDLRVFAETNPMSASGWLTREVTGKQQQVLAGKWQQTYHDWLKVGSGGTATTVGAGGAVSSGPALPFTSVQFNRSGQFGGSEHFEFIEESSTVTVGLDHTPGGGDNLLVGSGHTVS